MATPGRMKIASWTFAGVAVVLMLEAFRSVFVADSFGWGTSSRYYFLDFDSGRVVWFDSWGSGVPIATQRWHYAVIQPSDPSPHILTGLAADYGPGFAWFAFPAWLLSTVCVVVSVICWRFARRRAPNLNGFAPAIAETRN
jgi:hypothetical protein